MIEFDVFQKVDLRVGVVTAVEDFPRARKPSYRVTVDFGSELGTRRSSVQATNYSPEELVGLQVVAVANLAPRNIAGFMSEVLILGVEGEDGQLSLLSPTRGALPGARVY
jgi:tRNA-binding protein